MHVASKSLLCKCVAWAFSGVRITAPALAAVAVFNKDELLSAQCNGLADCCISK